MTLYIICKYNDYVTSSFTFTEFCKQLVQIAKQIPISVLIIIDKISYLIKPKVFNILKIDEKNMKTLQFKNLNIAVYGLIDCEAIKKRRTLLVVNQNYKLTVAYWKFAINHLFKKISNKILDTCNISSMRGRRWWIG